MIPLKGETISVIPSPLCGGGLGWGVNELATVFRCSPIQQYSGAVVVRAGLAEAICGRWVRVPSKPAPGLTGGSGKSHSGEPELFSTFFRVVAICRKSIHCPEPKSAGNRIREPAAASRGKARLEPIQCLADPFVMGDGHVVSPSRRPLAGCYEGASTGAR